MELETKRDIFHIVSGTALALLFYHSILDNIFETATGHINSFVDDAHKGGEIRKEVEDIAFGLKALKITFVMDESIGSADALEEQLKEIEGVKSVETIDVRRALG